MCAIARRIEITESKPSGEKSQSLQQLDYLAFGITGGLVLAVYLATLTPEIALGFSGVFGVGAMYMGIAHPPGHPVWTLYGWLFTVLVPLSNIAWRVALSSAVAGALTCGIIAALVSRSADAFLETFRDNGTLSQRERRALRISSGCAAGMGFGFDGAFWGSAIVPDAWPLSMLFVAVVVWLLFFWALAPERKHLLIAAAFVFGLAFTNSEVLLSAGLGFELLVMVVRPRLIQDICFANLAVFAFKTWLGNPGFLGIVDPIYPSLPLPPILAALSAVTWVAEGIRRRGLFNEWRVVLGSLIAFCIGTSLFLLLPILSMTNPPINWAYPRTVAGFVHCITRGQYEALSPVTNIGQLLLQFKMLAVVSLTELGLGYVVLAVVPFFMLRRLSLFSGRWVIGMGAIYLSLSVFLFSVLNVGDDRSSRELNKVFHSASHLILTILAGYGMILVAAEFSEYRSQAGQSLPDPSSCVQDSRKTR